MQLTDTGKVSSDEEWREVPGYPGYEASSKGRIRSWRKRGFGLDKRRETPYYLKPSIGASGYRQYSLKCGPGKKYGRHTAGPLVLMAFVGPRPENMVCCHNNGDPSDNRLENLRWDTQAANMADKMTHGTMPYGERHPNAKLTDAEASVVRRLKGHVPIAAVSRALGIDPVNINKLWKGETYSNADV